MTSDRFESRRIFASSLPFAPLTRARGAVATASRSLAGPTLDELRALCTEHRVELAHGLLTGFVLLLRVLAQDEDVALLVREGSQARSLRLAGLDAQPKLHWLRRVAERAELTEEPLATAAVVFSHARGAADPSGEAFVLAASERDDAVELVLVDHSGRAIEAELEHALDLYEHVLRSLCACAAEPFRSADAMPSDELHRVVFGLNDTATPLEPDEPLYAAAVRWARQAPDAPAIVQGERVVSYAELVRDATRLARRLPSLDPEQPVALVLRPGPAAVVGMLAILLAGGAYVPVDPGLPDERRRIMLETAGVKHAICADPAPALERSMTDVVLVDGEGEPSERELPGLRSTRDLAYVIFTSGSTGRPKGVMIEHRSVVSVVRCINQRLGIGPGDRLLLASSLGFDLSVYDVFGALSGGATLVIPLGRDTTDPFELARCVREHGVTVWNSVPSSMSLVLEADAAALGSLRAVLLSGDWVPVDLPDRIRRAVPNGRVVALGGATEGTIWSNAFEVETVDPRWASIPYGYPLPNNAFYVLGHDLLPVPRGVRGELAIGGLGVARGYVSAPELTARAFVQPSFPTPFDGPIYRTGDLGRLTLEGHLEILGRIDTQVKVNGYRVELGEVEHAARNVPGIDAAVASCLDRPSGGQEIVLHAVARDANRRPEPRELLARIAETLPAYMVPTRVMFIDRLPLSPNGKVDRKRLPHFPRHEGQLVASDALETRLAELWQDALQVSPSADTGFAASGGSSLAAVRLIVGLERELGLRLSVARLLDLGSFAELVRFARSEPALLPPVEPDYTLTPLQRSYVAGEGDCFPLGNSIGHIHQEFELDESAATRLGLALRRMLETHPMLRAYVSGGEHWTLCANPEPPLREVDLRALPPAEQSARLQALRHEQRLHGLPSDRWPLFDLTLVRLGDGLRLLLRIDLVLLDGVGHAALLDELGRLLSDPSSAVRVPRGTFFGYRAAWHVFQGSRRYAAAREFWSERAASLPEPPQLPQLCSPSQLPRSLLDQRVVTLQPGEWERLGARASLARVSPGNVVLAAFALVIARWSASQRFTLNVLYYNRESLVEDVDGILGNFSSTLLLDTEVRPAEPFVALARRLSASLTEQLQHAIYDGVDVLAERKRLTRSLHGGMPVVFTSLLGVRERQHRHVLRERALGVQTPYVHLDCLLREIDGRAVVTWSFQEGLFPTGLVEDLCHTFAALLSALAEPGADWGRPPSLPLPAWHVERLELLRAGPPVELGSTLTAALRTVALASPERVAVRSDERVLRYGELLHAGWAVAHRLLAAGLVGNALVGVLLDKGWRQPVALVGILEARGAYLPLRPADPDERLQQLVAQSGIELLVTDATHAARIRQLAPSLRVVVLDDVGLDDPTTRPAVQPQPDDLAYVLYTSGSTGAPKGVRIAHAGVVNTIMDVNRTIELGPDDRVLAASAYTFDLSVYDVFGAFAVGAELVIPPQAELREPGLLLARVLQHGVTVWSSVPALMEMLVEHAPPTTTESSRLRAVLLSGDWIPLSLPDRVRAVFAPQRLLSLGGATEASIWSVMFPIEAVDPAWRSIPYGRAMAGQSIHVLDAELRPCPIGVAGEAYIGGVGVAMGYHEDEARTAASFVRHPETGERLYKTGDACRVTSAGYVEILGRLDDQVKVRGHRIELGEIEAAARNSYPGLDVVAAVGSWRGGTELVLYVRAAAGRPPSPRAILQQLRTKLPDYCVPSAVVPLEHWPTTPNGKVDRKRLPPPTRETNARSEPPLNASERSLAELWELVLGTTGIRRSDSFFELGGQSMSAVRLSTLVRERMGVALPLATIYATETLAALAAEIDRATPDPPAKLLRLSGSDGASHSPLFLVHPIGGHVLGYRELALALGRRGHPVHAFQADGLEGDTAPRGAVQDLARHYLEHLRRQHAHGPYHLGGWSFGGLVAYEMARMLRAENGEIGAVVLIDTWFPRMVEGVADDDSRVFASFIADLRASAALPPVDLGNDREAILRRTCEDMGLGSEGLVMIERMLATYAAHLRAMASYEPEPLDLPLLLIKAMDGVPSSYYRGPFGHALGWENTVQPRVVELPGDHYTLLRQPSLGDHIIEEMHDG